MIGGKMVGTTLAPMITDIKRVSQVFQRFKSTDMLEISTARLTRGRVPATRFNL
jgi:hypothetical protein